MSSVLERINGYNKSNVLGYFNGKNAIVSLAVGSAGDVLIKQTGAVASFIEIQRYLKTDDLEVILTFINEQGIKRIDDSEFVLDTIEDDYKASYAAQYNIKRIIDIVQQRAVILATSTIDNDVEITEGFKTRLDGDMVDSQVNKANVISLLIERADVFDCDERTLQGVPTGKTVEGMNLAIDLCSVSLLDKKANEVALVPSKTASDKGHFAVQVFKKLPALY